MNEQSIIYASVDLELSGFDPEVDEIIEIGIARFTVVAGVPTLLDTWESLVKPSKAIRERIVGLTGINATEIQVAPSWEIVREKVTELLSDSVIVGHGVSLDCKFLEAQGVSVSSRTIDTLELAQIFLPTHHSYNLENLAHELVVSHTTAHRALADAEATFGILVRFAGIYNSLPKETQARIVAAVAHREFAWMFFITQASAVAAPKDPVVPMKKLATSLVSPPTAPGVSTATMSVGQRVEPDWNDLATSMPPWVVAAAQRERVFSIARQGIAQPYLGAYEQASERALQELLENPASLAHKEVIALCKVLVWQGQGSKHNILAELNWSIIGTELKRLFTSGYTTRTPAGFGVTDFRSLPDFRDHRNVWIEYIDTYISWLEQKSGMQLVWHSMIAAVKQIYNPETGFGDQSRSSQVAGAIGQIDVFFARVLLLIKNELHLTSGALSEEDLGLYAASRMWQAAANLHARLKEIASPLDAQLQKVIDGIAFYFFPTKIDNSVRWIEFSDTRCAFVLRPIHIDMKLSAGTGGTHLVFTSDIHNDQVAAFLKKRIGVSSVYPVEYAVKAEFSISKQLTEVGDRMELTVSERITGEKEAIILFPTLAQLKDYYDQYYSKLGLGSSVVAIGIHGGVNKILRNFAHSSRLIILAAIPSLIGFAAEPLALPRVIFAGMPFVDLAHPYNRRLAQDYFETPIEFERATQLLSFVQVMRVFDMNKLLELELLFRDGERPIAEFLVSELQ